MGRWLCVNYPSVSELRTGTGVLSAEPRLVMSPESTRTTAAAPVVRIAAPIVAGMVTTTIPTLLIIPAICITWRGRGFRAQAATVFSEEGSLWHERSRRILYSQK